ncbi:hypothetical protein CSB11_01840 [Candidatus Campbellbacteria bacterium]|nr:MAG: hypothetical protein CSB11_01840 [Candidatus Campbellbacteria bacterium]
MNLGQRVLVVDLPPKKSTKGYYDFSHEVCVYTLSCDKKSYQFLLCFELSDLRHDESLEYVKNIFAEGDMFVPKTCGKVRFDLRIEDKQKFISVLKNYFSDIINSEENCELQKFFQNQKVAV